ncbi:MAG TPA: hypothetical protein VMU15_03750 [Anaeromyxobacter sp.]|nr:hypothetical protein [Anaeromyxobacter sp.]
MLLHSALSYCGLIAAAVLLLAGQSRGIALIAVLAAALQVLLLHGTLQLHVAHIPLALALALAVPSLVAWFRASSKTAITAGALAAFVGLVQLLAYAAPRL